MRNVDTAMLRYYMEKAGCKYIQDLEKKSGVNRITLAGVVNNRIQPSADVIDRIMIGLNIPTTEIGNIFFQ